MPIIQCSSICSTRRGFTGVTISLPNTDPRALRLSHRLLIYAYLTRRINPVYGLLGFFFFISTPAVLRLSHWAYIDLGITFYSTASLLCLLRWSEERDSMLACSGRLVPGFCAGDKTQRAGCRSAVGLLFVLVIGRAPRVPLEQAGFRSRAICRASRCCRLCRG